MGAPSLQELHRLGGYREYSPPRDLQAVIDSVWLYVRPLRDTTPLPGRGHRVIPETSVSLCVRGQLDENGMLENSELIFIGPTRSIRFFSPQPGACLASIRLKPEWCRDLLRIDPSDHVNEQNAIPLGKHQPGLLRDRLARSGPPLEALSILFEEIRALRDAARISRAAALAHSALERIRTSDAPIHTVGRSLHASERNLRRAIVESTGTGPKYIQRVGRLHRVVAAADRLAEPDWSRLAAETGFCDQAHLIQEFRLFTQRSPRELHAERLAQQAEWPESPRQS